MAITLLLGSAACEGEDGADGHGNFEAIEVVVSSQTSGILQELVAVEGERLDEGTPAALVDTIQIALERAQLTAQRDGARARMVEVSSQLDLLGAQLSVARRGHERTQRLFDARAATAQQLDQAERDVYALEAQERALRAQRGSIENELDSLRARIEQTADRLARACVVNPVAGTVLATYARVGELVQPGTPLYRIANLDTLQLRAYVTGSQLPHVRLGGDVRVTVDDGFGSLRSLPGIIGWISDRAEFTPTPVQTREERVELVYAVKVRVPNPSGLLKIGMPGEMSLGSDGHQQGAGESRP